MRCPFLPTQQCFVRLTVRHSKVVSTARQELVKRESEKLHDDLPFRENSLGCRLVTAELSTLHLSHSFVALNEVAAYGANTTGSPHVLSP